MLTVLFFIFTLSVIIQLVYYLFIFRGATISKQQNALHIQLPVSIIICAKNEEKNISNSLKAILSQEYPTFEIIVVNDASTDYTLSILKTIANKHLQVKIIDIKPSTSYTGNKKNALTKGIEAATYKHLLFTDADCIPISKNWITEMASHFTKDKAIILGYGAYQKIPHSFLNKLIRFETLLTATQYFSYNTIGLPYMGVGRNLAYTKTIFTKANGFIQHKHIKSGDDDLLINQVANKNNIINCIHPDSFTVSIPKKTLSTWFQQKRRHVTTANHYKPIHQFLLGTFYLSQFLFWFLAIILLFFSFNWQLVTILLIIRLSIQYLILGNSAKKFNEKDLIPAFPVLEIVLIAVQLSIFTRNLISKPTSW